MFGLGKGKASNFVNLTDTPSCEVSLAKPFWIPSEKAIFPNPLSFARAILWHVIKLSKSPCLTIDF